MLMTQPSQFVQCGPFVQRTARFLADWVIPDTCVLCHLPLAKHSWHEPLELADHLCAHCRVAVTLNHQPCSHCALPLPQGQKICGRCSVSPLADYALAPVLHQHCGAHLIKRLKFHQGEREAQALCSFMLTGVRLSYPDRESLPDYLVPVPIASRTMLSRGFNQADWLAQPLGKRLGIPILAGSFKRKNGPSQRNQTRAARMQLPAQTFTARRFEHLKKQLEQRHVAIVDDVLTTGSTARVLTKKLRQAGAKRVDVWVATRA